MSLTQPAASLRSRCLIAVSAVLVLCATSFMTFTGTAAAETVAQFHVTEDVSGRHSATAAPSPDYGVPAGGVIGVQCQVIGEPVGPVGNDLYFLATYDGRFLYVPDTWTDSPHHAGEPPLSGIPMCDTAQPAASTWQPNCDGNDYVSEVQVQDFGLGQFEIKVTPTHSARYAALANDIENGSNQIWHAVQACVSGLYGVLADGIYQQIVCHELGSLSGPLEFGGATYDFESWREPVEASVAIATECNWGGWPYTPVGEPYRPDRAGNNPTF